MKLLKDYPPGWYLDTRDNYTLQITKSAYCWTDSRGNVEGHNRWDRGHNPEAPDSLVRLTELAEMLLGFNKLDLR